MLLLLPILLLWPQVTQPVTAPPAIDFARAKRVFDTSCAGCHGPEGRGGKGPSLAVPKLRHARTDDELAEILRDGIPGTEMPPSWYLGEEGMTLAAAYVRMLGASATPPQVAGDAAQGKALWRSKGACAGCHTIGAEGHAYGPDLSDIGARRSADSLRQALMDPNAEPAKAVTTGRSPFSLRESLIAPDAEAGEGFVPVHAVTRQGVELTGLRVNEDNFTIQILEPSGRFHSFRKDALTKLEERPTQSVMPSYKTVFSSEELQNLVAYLSSLRGEQ
jgi:mono/diheme cytochrome c family protein